MFVRSLVCLSAFVANATTFADSPRLSVFPSTLTLHSPQRPVRLIVTRWDDAGLPWDVTNDCRVTCENPQVAAVRERRVTAVANGETVLQVRHGELAVAVPVQVETQSDDRMSLRTDVLPVLSRQGCSSGACHGSPTGKGGFRLSLRAFDPSVDELTLRKEFFSRRTNPLNPETSLLLRKPLTELPHAGGRRLTVESPSYRTLRTWIAEGARMDPPDAPRCESITLHPPSGRELTADRPRQRFSVLATFSDNTIRDVTDQAVFTSSETSIARIDEDAVVHRVEASRGQAAITVRYLEHMTTSFVVSIPDGTDFRWSEPESKSFVDRLVNAKLRQLQFTPSEPCTDAEFVRRLTLDVTGLLPTAEAARTFLADTSTDKRTRLIDRLLASREHAQFMALQWGDILRIRTANVSSPGVFKYYRWLLRAMQNNVPYDEFARQLLTSSGSTFENPPSNYYRTASDTNDCAESTAQVFLGARLECAKCHNHPHERWTQDNYYGLGAFFHRVQRDATDRKDEFFISVAVEGDVVQPRTGKKAAPWLPGVGEVDVETGVDRRTVFTDWLVRPDNPFFARVEVNRLWSAVMGRGIVDPIDDFRDSNPPSNSELLDALAADFVAHGFDRRHTLRTILNSRTYQRSSRSTPSNESDDRYFSRYYRRLLSAEQLLDAICDATGVGEQFRGLPAGTRATQLPSPDFGREFLKVFGQPKRESVCRCERSDDLNLTQALQIANGAYVHEKLTNSTNRPRRLLAEKKSAREIVEDCYLSAFSRFPTDTEFAAFERFSKQRSDSPADKTFEDLLWALINSNEFLFQH